MHRFFVAQLRSASIKYRLEGDHTYRVHNGQINNTPKIDEIGLRLVLDTLLFFDC